MPKYLRSSRKTRQRKRWSYYLLGLLFALTVPAIGYMSWSQQSRYTGAAASNRLAIGSSAQPYEVFTWKDEINYPMRISESQGLMHEGKLYVFGGFNGFHTDSKGQSYLKAIKDSYAYDLQAKTWTRLADMPLALTHSPVAIDGDTIYFIGGFDGNHPGPSTTKVLKYSISQNSWSYGPDLPDRRGSGAAGIIGRNLHYAGGTLRQNGDEYVDKTDHWVLNLDNPDGWVARKPMLYPRNHVGATVVNNKLYVVGGQKEGDERDGNLSYTEVYDPQTDTWTRLADMPTQRGHVPSSVLAHNGLIYVLAGTKNGGGYGLPSEAFEVFDPEKNVWMKMPNMPTKDGKVQGRKSPVAGIWNGQLYVTTGDFSPNTSATVETWSVKIDGVWETLSNLPVAMGDMVTAQVENKVYVMSGNQDSTYVYNLSKDIWEGTVAKRPFPGELQVSEVIQGEIYVVGGISGGKGKLQIFNPVTNTWTIGPDLPRPLSGVSTAVINNKLYVAGGTVSGRQINATVYEFDPSLNRWRKRRNMLKGVRFAASGTDGKLLYVFGGEGYNTVNSPSTTPGLSRPTSATAGTKQVIAPQSWIQIFDPVRNRWSRQVQVGGKNVAARMDHVRLHTKKAEYWNGQFYLFGGQMAAGTHDQKTYADYVSYDPSQNAWQIRGVLKEKRFGLSTIRLGSRVYLFGGGVALLNSGGEQNINATQTVDVLNL